MDHIYVTPQHAANVLPVIEAIKRARATTLRDIADALNARGVATAREGSGTLRWCEKSLRGRELSCLVTFVSAAQGRQAPRYRGRERFRPLP